MITNRSIHMPTFTKIEITNRAVMLVRTFLDHRSHGRNALHTFMVHPAHQNGPNARYQNAAPGRRSTVPGDEILHAVRVADAHPRQEDELREALEVVHCGDLLEAEE